MQYNLSEREKIVMKQFWKDNSVLTSPQLMDELGDYFDFPPQLHRVLNSLLDKGAIYVCGLSISGKKNMRQFKATMKEEEFTAQLLIHDIGDKKRLAKVAMALVEEVTEKKDSTRNEEDDTLIHELEAMIEKYKNKNEL